ncbi:pyridoxamine 5'-phosphate oxidase family protein [Pelagibacterium xiamenense]|uniref:pyridoxamine 5'-phosphate oxidase family protein n=1 Tax=Pelagibacterium xiamenense TaxID=2901140 RepID=UPI001E300375|nr:pyridoxamine 5'-phosphate oxidase family protein [Pelagibacterium xiamenense]MCD7060409.1 pyridoxamine 5'-phosphate oxidase family protein [Pelagibacterium xiamenense]
MNVHTPPDYARARQPRRAHYDAATVNAILDTGLVGHVGFIAEGRPMVIPMAYARHGDTIYLHGASKARIVAMHKDGDPITMTVTQLDGIVAARSGFHHSMNYRAAVVHGHTRLVTDLEEIELALKLITEHLLPDRWEEVRPMLPKERKATGVLALEIEATSAKIRHGPPVDEQDDHALPIWAGVIPIVTGLGHPVGDGLYPGELPPPPSAAKARAKFA